MLTEPACFTRGCRHYIGVKQDEDGEEEERHACDAFPDGIPEQVTSGTNRHAVPLPGQKNDVVFEAEDDQARE